MPEGVHKQGMPKEKQRQKQGCQQKQRPMLVLQKSKEEQNNFFLDYWLDYTSLIQNHIGVSSPPSLS